MYFRISLKEHKVSIENTVEKYIQSSNYNKTMTSWCMVKLDLFLTSALLPASITSFHTIVDSYTVKEKVNVCVLHTTEDSHVCM